MKKYLVVDSDVRNGFNFQYMIVDNYNGLKIIHDFQELLVRDSKECYKIVLELSTKNKINYIMINRLGINEIIYELIKDNQYLSSITIGYLGSSSFNHNIIFKYIEDLQNNKLGITSSTNNFVNVINENLIRNLLYTTESGFLKIDKFTNNEDRKKLHLILALYGGLITKLQ